MNKLRIMGFIDIIFVIGSLLLFVGFFTVHPASLYPTIIFLLGILIIKVFHEKIQYIEISKEGVKLKMLEANIQMIEKEHKRVGTLKKKWHAFQKSGGIKNV